MFSHIYIYYLNINTILNQQYFVNKKINRSFADVIVAEPDVMISFIHHKW